MGVERVARGGPSQRRWLAGLQLAVLAIAAWVRMVRYRWIVAGPDVLPTDTDSAYHLHRILTTARDWSYPGLRDPMLAWPEGALSIWPPGWDWIGAAFVVALGGGDDPVWAARLAAVLPVVFGVAAVAVVMHVGARLAGDAWVGALAGLVAALVPQAVAISELGRIDHHAFEMLCVAFMMGWSLALVSLGPTASRGRRLALEIVGALLIALSIWVALVTLIVVALAMVALVLSSLMRRDRLTPWVGSGAPAFVGGAGLLAISFAPLVGEHGQAWSYAYPCFVQPVLLVIAAVAIGASAWSERRAGCEGIGQLMRRALITFGIVMVVGGLLVAVLPGLRAALVSGVGEYLATADPWLERISELRPLMDFEREHPWSYVGELLGVAAWALPVTLPLALWATHRRQPSHAVVLGVFALSLVALSLQQNRWSRGLVVVLALWTALGLHQLVGAVVARLGKEDSPAMVQVVAWALAVLALVVPHLGQLMPPPGPSPRIAVDEAGIHLRRHATADRGVLARWDLGHRLLAVGHLPIISSGFGPYSGRAGFEDERRSWRASPEDVYRLLDRRKLGWVVAGASTFRDTAVDGLKPFADGLIDPRYFRTVPMAAMIFGGSALVEIGVPHLEHLCPRYASPTFVAESSQPAPELWVFEYVRGALLRGEAAPGSRVIAETFLRHGGGVVPYSAVAVAGPSGRFSVRFPIPGRYRSAYLESGRHVRLHLPGGMVELEISERAVQDGLVIDVPPPS